MNSPRRPLTLLAFALAFLLSALPAYPQQDQSKLAEPNYEATLQVLAASTQPGPGLPASLSSVAKQLRSDFNVSNLTVVNTYLGRLSGTGSLRYKGVSTAYMQDSLSGSPTFLDWNLMGMKQAQNATGQNVYQFQAFQFGARVPVRTGAPPEDNPKAVVPINYESIGLTLDRVSVRENVPTLVGTLTQPKPDATLFLILTIRNVDR